MKKHLKGFSLILVLIFTMTLFLSFPVMGTPYQVASEESTLLTFGANFTPLEIGSEKPVPADLRLLYHMTAEKDSPIITNRDTLVTEISLVGDDPEKKVMTLKYDDQLYVKLYYYFQPEYQVGDTIVAGKTIAKYSSDNESILTVEVLKDGERQLVKNYIQLEKN